MRNHLDGFVIVVFDKNIVSKGDAYALAVVISLEKQMEIFLYYLLLLLIIKFKLTNFFLIGILIFLIISGTIVIDAIFLHISKIYFIINGLIICCY